jgi:hypothetical protein
MMSFHLRAWKAFKVESAKPVKAAPGQEGGPAPAQLRVIQLLMYHFNDQSPLRGSTPIF